MPLTLLDVGSGLGDIPAALQRSARAEGVELELTIADLAESALRAANETEGGGCSAVVCHALQLPFADGSFEIVTCSQLLHHFPEGEGGALVKELDRVARSRVIISDIRRSWGAVAGIWLASFPLRFHPVSRHDGVVSVLRGFTRGELEELIQSAVGVAPTVRRHPGFRLTASWSPAR